MANNQCKLVDELKLNTPHLFPSYEYKFQIILNQFQFRQQCLFQGYFKQVFILNGKDIPSDIVQLCHNFFTINIRLHLCQRHSFINTLCATATKFRETGEHFVSSEILECLACFDPNNPRCYNLLGLTLWQWNMNSIRAEVAFQKAIELKPQSHIFKWNYARLLEAQHKYESASKQYMKAAELDANESAYFFKAAMCYSELGEFEKAKINYLQSIQLTELNDKKSEYYLHYASLLWDMNQTDEAIKFLEKAFEIYSDHWDIQEQMHQFAKCLADWGYDEKAKIYYKKWLELTIKHTNKDNKDDINVQVAESCLNLAECYFELEQYEKAKINYMKAIQLDIDVFDQNPRYYVNYAKLLCKMNDFSTVNQYLEKAIERNKDEEFQKDVLYEIAVYLRDEIRNFKLSEMYYKKCLEYNDVEFIFPSYGHLLYLMQRYDESDQYFTMYINSNTKQNYWCYLYSGLLQNKLGNIAKANDLLLDAVAATDYNDINYMMNQLKRKKEQNTDMMDNQYMTRYERILKQSPQSILKLHI